MLKLPRFSPDGLTEASICVHINKDKDEKSTLEELTEWSLVDEERGIYARRTVHVFDTHVHYHLDVGIDKEQLADGSKSTPKKLLTIPLSLQHGLQTTTLWGTFRVTLKRLAKDNFVRALSCMSINRAGYELQLRSCSLNMFSDTRLREMRWSRVNESDISISFAAVDDIKLEDGALLAAAQLTSDVRKQLLPLAKRLTKSKATRKPKRKKRVSDD